MKQKILVAALALTLVLCLALGGTLAWLSAKTQKITNTFTYGSITLTLAETDDGDGDLNANSYKMTPGGTITKDPVVTVAKGSEACFVFVELVESDNFDTYMEYTVNTDWTLLEDGVYYQVVDVLNADDDKAMSVIDKNTIKVKDAITFDAFTRVDTPEAVPTLDIIAYAVQSANMEGADVAAQAAAAWAIAKTLSE